MNEGGNRWWNAYVLALVLVLLVALVAAKQPLAEGVVGVIGLVILGICLIALMLVVAVLWPGLTRRARQNLEASPGKAFVVGLVNYVFLGAIGLVLMNLGPIAAIGLLLGAALLVGTFLGLPAVAALIGARLHGLRERDATPWGEIVAGGLALDLAILVPVVGWFILLPALFLWSFGAAALALVSRQKTETADVT
jgi:hypothetical protein